MNTVNNKKAKETRKKIENAFLEMLKHSDITTIGVTDICNEVGVNRSTFYLHYNNINDLVEQIEAKMMKKLTKEMNATEYLKISDSERYLLPYLNYIYSNQEFFRVFYKYSVNNKYETRLEEILYSVIKKHLNYTIVSNSIILDYCLEYYEAGIFTIIKKWILNNYKETPEEIVKIIAICTTNKFINSK
ncbi:MAG: TetR/AcrR family transcriptional regulator [Bacilli bacterium]|nr:TetR/AcrR family transcriptional regulator [Bacilli bacterium]